MTFVESIVAVVIFLEVCLAQINNGPFNSHFKFNTLGESEKGILQNIADKSNYKGNYVNFAANQFSQSKLSQNRLSDFLNQKTAPLENYQNNIPVTNVNQQQFLNLLQQNVQKQDSPPSWNTLQGTNLVNNIHLTPPNRLQFTNNILPAPNIANNNFLSNVIPNTQPIMPPSLTISTSLPSFIPRALPTSNYIRVQPNNQVSTDINTNKVYAAISEPPKVTTNTNPINYYKQPNPKPTEGNSHKSLNMKTLLPLILNLLNDKGEDCPCCSNCHNNQKKLANIPSVISGYSKQKRYGTPADDSSEYSESEEELNEVETRRRYRNNLYDKGKQNTSDE